MTDDVNQHLQITPRAEKGSRSATAVEWTHTAASMVVIATAEVATTRSNSMERLVF